MSNPSLQKLEAIQLEKIKRENPEHWLDIYIMQQREQGMLAYWIHDQENYQAFYLSDKEVQLGWNRYVEMEIVKFDDKYSPDRQVTTMHKWSPPLSFRQWAKANNFENRIHTLASLIEKEIS